MAWGGGGGERKELRANKQTKCGKIFFWNFSSSPKNVILFEISERSWKFFDMEQMLLLMMKTRV